MENNFLEDFKINDNENNNSDVFDVFDRKSSIFQAVVYEMAMHGSSSYTSEKTGVKINDIEKLHSEDYFNDAVQRAKEEIERDGSNPIKFKANILAHIAIDTLHRQMIGSNVKDADKTKAATVVLEIAGQYNKKEEGIQTVPITISFKDVDFSEKK